MTDKERAQRFYELINGGWFGDYEESTYRRFLAVRELENITGKQFNNTEDFHRKMERYLRGENSFNQLRDARKAKGWSLTELGIHLGISKQAVHQMETGKRPYGEKALKWLKTTSSYAEASFA